MVGEYHILELPLKVQFQKVVPERNFPLYQILNGVCLVSLGLK